jgi:hypothetical protein
MGQVGTVALEELPPALRPVLADHYTLAAATATSAPANVRIAAPAAADAPTNTAAAEGDTALAVAAGVPTATLAAVRSVLLSQLRLLEEDHIDDPTLFPPQGALAPWAPRCRCEGRTNTVCLSLCVYVCVCVYVHACV